MRGALTRAVCSLLAGGAALAACTPSEPDPRPTAEACAPDPAWFPHARTPEPASDTFASRSQCEFHQWSWQAFLWLTQPDASGSPRFLAFTNPAELFGELPTGALLPRMGKAQAPETIDEFLQAGTDGIMTDQTGRPVYYAQYVDPVFADFVTSNGLTDPATLRDFPADSSFPVGAMELKVSWKVVEEGDTLPDHFTMDAEVFRLANRRGTIVVDTAGTDTVTLALVGFHVAGRVKDHPEMIWATFEHRDNAPAVFTHANVDRPVGMLDPVSDRDWTFYAADTTRSGCNVNTASSPVRRLDEATQTITPVVQACREYEYGNVPVAPGDTASPIQRAALQNDRDVASLNEGVTQALDPGDVWSNYFEVGAVWFTGLNALRPGQTLDGLCVEGSEVDGRCLVPGDTTPRARLVGSLRLSNATIETFTQSQSTLYNCFRCHNSAQRLHTGAVPGAGEPGAALPAKNVNISHIIVNGYFRHGGTP